MSLLHACHVVHFPARPGWTKGAPGVLSGDGLEKPDDGGDPGLGDWLPRGRNRNTSVESGLVTCQV